jgi:hypothetical protein
VNSMLDLGETIGLLDNNKTLIYTRPLVQQLANRIHRVSNVSLPRRTSLYDLIDVAFALDVALVLTSS